TRLVRADRLPGRVDPADPDGRQSGIGIRRARREFARRRDDQPLLTSAWPRETRGTRSPVLEVVGCAGAARAWQSAVEKNAGVTQLRQRFQPAVRRATPLSPVEPAEPGLHPTDPGLLLRGLAGVLTGAGPGFRGNAGVPAFTGTVLEVLPGLARPVQDRPLADVAGVVLVGVGITGVDELTGGIARSLGHLCPTSVALHLIGPRSSGNR